MDGSRAVDPVECGSRRLPIYVVDRKRLHPRAILRARPGLGLLALIANVMLLMPPGFGAAAAVAYGLTAITSALVLGLVSGAMLFGHWYLIDLEMPVDYLRTFVRLLGVVLVADLVALGLALGLPAILGSASSAAAVHDLFASHLGLLAVRLLLGPIAIHRAGLDVLADAENPADDGRNRPALHSSDVGPGRRNARPLHTVSHRNPAVTSIELLI